MKEMLLEGHTDIIWFGVFSLPVPVLHSHRTMENKTLHLGPLRLSTSVLAPAGSHNTRLPSLPPWSLCWFPKDRRGDQYVVYRDAKVAIVTRQGAITIIDPWPVLNCSVLPRHELNLYT
jgi:hypothetical protein